jgi:hypothetical protein
MKVMKAVLTWGMPATLALLVSCSPAMAASTTTSNVVITVKHSAAVIAVAPSAPSIFDDLAAGQIVFVATVTMTNGKAFAGQVSFSDPSNVFSLVPASPQTTPPSWNVVVGANGLLSMIPAGQAQIIDTVSITAKP